MDAAMDAKHEAKMEAAGERAREAAPAERRTRCKMEHNVRDALDEPGTRRLLQAPIPPHRSPGSFFGLMALVACLPAHMIAWRHELYMDDMRGFTSHGHNRGPRLSLRHG